MKHFPNWKLCSLAIDMKPFVFIWLADVSIMGKQIQLEKFEELKRNLLKAEIG